LLGCNKCAYTGARTGTGTSTTSPGLLLQTATLWGSSHAAAGPNALYLLVSGGNDMRDVRSLFGSNSAHDQAGRELSAEATIYKMTTSFGLLTSRGDKTVLISSLSDLGFTPETFLLGATAASADASLRFNALMLTPLSTGASLGLHISLLDINGGFAMIRNDAVFNGGGIIDIIDISHTCAGFASSADNACNASPYADALRPSARTRGIIALAALQAVGAVPEPSTVLVLALGMGFVGYSVRCRTRSSCSVVV
jgi:outer membrane lipase/esterase